MINSFLLTVQKRHQRKNIVISYFVYLEILAKIPNQQKIIVYLSWFSGLAFCYCKGRINIPCNCAEKIRDRGELLNIYEPLQSSQTAGKRIK